MHIISKGGVGIFCPPLCTYAFYTFIHSSTHTIIHICRSFIIPTFSCPPIHLSIYPSTSHPPTYTFIYFVVLRCLGLNSRPHAHHQIRSSTTELHPRPRKVFLPGYCFRLPYKIMDLLRHIQVVSFLPRISPMS